MFSRSKKRKPNRLKGFDYSQNGEYFITICVQDMKLCFGEVIDGEMFLNKYGEIVRRCWLDLPNHYSNCVLDEYSIMPNHFHGIIFIDNDQISGIDVGTGFKPVPTNPKCFPLSEIVRGFKTFSSRKINDLNIINFRWQRSFHDHIIGDEKELDRIRDYIISNPGTWIRDRNNPQNFPQ